MKNYCKENLVADVINIDWPAVLSVELGDVNHSFNMFDQKINEVLDKHVPLKKLNKKQMRLESKPWITPGIVNSIKRRDRLLNDYIKTKQLDLKNKLHNDYKKLRNKIVAIIRKSKKKDKWR